MWWEENKPWVALSAIVIISGAMGWLFAWSDNRDQIARLTAERARAQSDAALLSDIADMREQLFQQDERKLGAVRWCVKLSPTPIACVSWSLENTR